MNLLQKSGITDFHLKGLISRKLSELNCPVDDEFSEYVLLMLHNKKDEELMKSEMEMFLGKQSAVFTPWLFGVLDPTSVGEPKTKKKFIAGNNLEETSDSGLPQSSDKRKKKRKKSSSSSSSSSSTSSSSSSSDSSDEGEIRKRRNGLGMMRSDMMEHQRSRTRSPTVKDRGLEKQLEILKAIQAIDFKRLLEEDKKKLKEEIDNNGSPKSKAPSPPPRAERKKRNYRNREESIKDGQFSDISDEDLEDKKVSKYSSVANSFIEAVTSATLTVTAGKNKRHVEDRSRTPEGIKLPLIVELGVHPNSGKPVIMGITPAVKLEDIPHESKQQPSHDWPRVEAGVVRNAVPGMEMSNFKKEVTQVTNFVINELYDKQTRVVLRCKFWPDCPNGKMCQHHHPMNPCKLFPSCPHINSCYDIHPICRQNMGCRVNQCNFTHTDTIVRSLKATIPCYYGKGCPRISECGYLHFKGEMKKKKKKVKKNKKRKHSSPSARAVSSPNARAVSSPSALVISSPGARAVSSPPPPLKSQVRTVSRADSSPRAKSPTKSRSKRSNWSESPERRDSGGWSD